MLQQTQVTRVIPKYLEFSAQFPDVGSLASAGLGEVLTVWNGLGYNRRAKFLWQSAQRIENDFGGNFPDNTKALQKLPGVGANTSGAILVYAFNMPEVFIETNIRTVFIRHFFNGQKDISDNEILALVKKTLPDEKGKEQPETRIHSAPGAMRKTYGLSHYRLWYWALMDYGSFLKQTVGNLARLSSNHSLQSKFEGSKRQVRGQVIRALIERPLSKLKLEVLVSDPRLEGVLDDLTGENLIRKSGDSYSLFS